MNILLFIRNIEYKLTSQANLYDSRIYSKELLIKGLRKKAS